MDGKTVYSAKVAIPRLKKTDHQQAVSKPKPPRARSETVNKACTRCRKRKTRCSGTRPRCTNCEKQGDVCVYEQPRRDRLRDALNKSDLLINLLLDLRGVVSDEHGRMIDDTLQQFEDDTPPSTPSLFTRSADKQRRSPSGGIGRDGSQATEDGHISASIDSDEEIDLLDEDLLPGPSETGYLGRNSQVQWMRTLQRKLDQAEGKLSHLPHAPLGDGDEAIAKRADDSHLHQTQSLSSRPLKDYYFYLDNDPVDNVKNVHPDIVPSAETAERLFGIYQSAVDTPFRILDDQFGDQLRTYYELVQRGGALNVCPKWKAIMNLVFAIGARFSQLVGENWSADDCDHSVYMARAVHFLELEKIATLVCAPDKSLIHATGLFSLYYLTIGHVSRAWYMIGVSLRHAQAAGFHLKNEDVSIPLEQKRAVAQTWWALHSIECILTSITGRPRVIYRNDCTVPHLAQLTGASTRKNTLTQPMSNLQSKSIQSTSSSTTGQLHPSREPTEALSHQDAFLNAWSKLDIIQHKTLTNLYSSRDAMYSWKRMPQEISSLMKNLSEWAEEIIPDGMLGTEKPSQQREKSLLYFYHQSVKIYITRPCLCRLDHRIRGQSAESAKFNQDTADACVQAALDLTSWLPDLSNPRWIYENGPWWSSVHIIMQAITVLLLELAQGSSHLSEDTLHVTACMEKLVQWLNTMRIVDGVAENAHKIVCDMLSKHEQFVRKVSPGSWLLKTFVAVPNTFTNMPSTQQHSNNPQLSGNLTYPFNDDIYTAANQESFDLNTLADPLNDPFGNVQFGQAQYPLFYGNQFTTLFDQEMIYDFEDPQSLGDPDVAGIMGPEPPLPPL